MNSFFSILGTGVKGLEVIQVPFNRASRNNFLLFFYILFFLLFWFFLLGNILFGSILLCFLWSILLGFFWFISLTSFLLLVFLLIFKAARSFVFLGSEMWFTVVFNKFRMESNSYKVFNEVFDGLSLFSSDKNSESKVQKSS